MVASISKSYGVLELSNFGFRIETIKIRITSYLKFRNLQSQIRNRITPSLQDSTLETLDNLYQPENLLNYCSNMLEGLIPRIAAFFTDTLEDHPAGKHRKGSANIMRYFQIIVVIAMKIKYFPAGNTMQMMVV